MLYNVRIFGKRYKSKTKEEIYILLDRFEKEINNTEFHTIRKIKFCISDLSDNCYRCRFFDNGKTIISLNKVNNAGV